MARLPAPPTRFALSNAEERRHNIYAMVYIAFAVSVSITLLVSVSLGFPKFEYDFGYGDGEPTGTWEVVNERPDEFNGEDVQVLVRDDLVYMQIKGEGDSASEIDSIQKEDGEIRIYTKPQEDSKKNATRVYTLTFNDVDLEELPNISQINSRGIVAEAGVVYDEA